MVEIPSKEVLIARRRRIVVPLEKCERAWEIAQGRNKKEKFFGAMTYDGRLEGFDAHFKGMMVEIAIAYDTHGEIDETIFERHGDKGKDNLIPNVGWFQSKGTPYLDPYLRIEPEHAPDKLHSDVKGFIGAIYRPQYKKNEVWIFGWAWKEEVVAKQQVKEVGDGQLVPGGPDNIILYEHELHGWDELKALSQQHT